MRRPSCVQGTLEESHWPKSWNVRREPSKVTGSEKQAKVFDVHLQSGEKALKVLDGGMPSSPGVRKGLGTSSRIPWGKS